MSVETYSPEQALFVSESAADHFRDQLQRLGGCGVRFSVRNAGCSGLSYVIDRVDEPASGDIEIALANGVSVFVDSDALPALRGMQIDYVREGLNRTLKLNNPNIVAACGCGESFSI